jgi:triacylglycerol esterase/lipase EstA (alpha/beta hydrolase family)
LNAIKRALEEKGFRVHNFGYPSTSESIEDIADMLNEDIRKLQDENRRIHFVTHSMGAIVLRYYLAHYRPKNPGRIVMIAPPNRGSIIAAYLKKWPPYRWFFGRAGQDLARASGSLTMQLPSPGVEFGIIAGGVGGSLGLNPAIPGDNDGTVGVEETKLDKMKDFILIKGQHSTLLHQHSVIRNVIAFILYGEFLHKQKEIKYSL